MERKYKTFELDDFLIRIWAVPGFSGLWPKI